MWAAVFHSLEYIMLATAKVSIDSLVETELPPMPGSALRVAALAQDVNSSTRAVADAIGLDPVLAARILRAANSPLYALERRITSLPMAVNALGNHNIHMLVVVYGASEAFDKKRQRSPVERSLWEHSVAVGLAAREISMALGMRGGEESFICGLLHDIGKLLMLRHDPELYGQMRTEVDEQGLLDQEQESYGFTHAQVGALVARRWSIPEEIAYAVYHHHQPSEAGQSMFMARIIDTADALANVAGVGVRGEAARDLSAAESVIALRLAEEQLTAVWERTQARLGQMLPLFD